jgi:hypothetical protein
MNQSERDVLAKLMGVAGSVPRPRAALSIESVSAYAVYVDDINELLWTITKACEGLCLAGHPELEEDAHYLNPTKLLQAYDSWLGQRIEDSWGETDICVEDFYQYRTYSD